jgi:hypothetical protein
MNINNLSDTELQVLFTTNSINHATIFDDDPLYNEKLKLSTEQHGIDKIQKLEQEKVKSILQK